MPPTSTPTVKLPMAAAQAEGDGADAAALFTWLTQLKAEEDAEDEPSRYASPPCYLAEFSDLDSANHTAK